MTKKIKVQTQECKRCGHTWNPRGPVIKVCPKCKTPYWDQEKIVKN